MMTDSFMPVTQFIRPNGDRRDGFIPAPVAATQAAEHIVNHGGLVTMEAIDDLTICFAVEDGEQDLGVVLVPYGVGVAPFEVFELVEKVAKKYFDYVEVTPK